MSHQTLAVALDDCCPIKLDGNLEEAVADWAAKRALGTESALARR